MTLNLFLSCIGLLKTPNMTSGDTNSSSTTDGDLPDATMTDQQLSRTKATYTNDQKQPVLRTASTISTITVTTQLDDTASIKKNPVQAYLRIRPLPSTRVNNFSYLQVLDDEHVSLIPPQDSYAYRKRQGASDQYQFTKVFTNNTNQKQLFEETTLPLLQSFLHGDNALIFAYGVTNSGKTYTMLGNETDAGIVPRTIQCLFDTLQDRLCQALLKPVMHGTVQAYELGSNYNDEHENRSILLDNGLQAPDYVMEISNENTKVLQVDASFEYGIWISFAEIYNEKVYDLLESPSKKQTQRPSLPLKYEYRSGYKYVAGLKHVRVNTAKEAYMVIQKGQQNRVVFSTLMNQSSSRSHSIFTISLIRCPLNSEGFVIEDPAYATLSKLSIVDLAGSERYRNTFNQGQRLKEAGNINKSLMVLGQCMEALRMNQLKIESGKRPGVVPFRQSKLTELFKNTFEGDGKVAIVVNINPFDTGFDENSGVMKFAAIAKEVTTVQQQKHKKVLPHDISEPGHKRLRTSTTDSMNELDSRSILDSPGQLYDGAFVNNLMEQMDSLREKWLEAEKRCATLEIDTRRQISPEVTNWKDRYMSLLKEQDEKLEQHLHEMYRTPPEGTSLLISDQLKAQQRQLSNEIDKLHAQSKEHDSETQKLLEKITQLECDKLQEQATVHRLHTKITQLKSVINGYRNNTTALSLDDPTLTAPSSQDLQRSDSGTTDSMGDHRYANFLELRKQLRRSVFKREELLEDAESILYQIEHFQGVTFDLVKNTKMGKLLKLITQEEFKSDPYLIQQRALELFKRFARLPQQQQQQDSTRPDRQHTEDDEEDDTDADDTLSQKDDPLHQESNDWDTTSGTYHQSSSRKRQRTLR
ncbi:kinesin motor domain-containing protein [Chlamydoabsidia padenii]|nr:kinesin motor domain-containing protein [Chlamydoabsidia padenii]